jgi:hypothetical protein
MPAPVPLLALAGEFVNCFTDPGMKHFLHFALAHAALWGAPHCVTETMRLTRVHERIHWTTLYAWMSRGRCSCRKISRTLFDLIWGRLCREGDVILAIDDTLVKRWGRKFFGLGRYVDPTDKNPGASRRKVWGHCWVLLAMLYEKARGQWFCFPLAALLFVPEWACAKGWRFQTKIELAVWLLRRLRLPGRLIVVVDNLYAKAQLANEIISGEVRGVLISRLRSNAAMYELPAKRRKGRRGRPAKRGKQFTPRQWWNKRSGRRILKAHMYGKVVALEAWVGVVMPSRTLGDSPILVAITKRRRGKKMNVFFSTDLAMDPTRLLEIYAARFKIEDAFDELKTHGGFADCRQCSARALKRHATLCLVSYSLLRLLSLTLAGAEGFAAEPWWRPTGPPSVTRMRRALADALAISPRLPFTGKPNEIQRFRKAA